MRFITQYPGYKVQIRPQRQRSLGDGSIEITTAPIYATFKTIADGGFIFENEEIQALKQFNFHGNTQDLGQATPSDPMHRLAVLDTNEFAAAEDLSPEDKQAVETKLLLVAQESPNDLFVVTTTPIAAPTPRYDSYDGDPEEFVVRLLEDGFDLEQVLYYEESFGPKRPEMIAALQEAIDLEKEQTVSA
jgi:hypothetical protein